MGYLERIKSPLDLKDMNLAETAELAEEIRGVILDTTSKNGGHVASNLGVVELTLALHRSFDLPRDSIVFDVGHQCYVHKLLTGRRERFSTLRKRGGLSGFTNRFESEYDAFGAGHSGTSVSAALGIAQANRLNGSDAYSVAVVGDGSFTNGMIYEALNNCSADNSNVIIVLNDNEMSISKNVGGMSSYLSEVSSSRWYIKFKKRVYAFCLKTKGFGSVFLAIGRFFKELIKKIFMTGNYFECLGLKYIGPIDGHDQELLELVFEQAKQKKRPCVVHVVTKKGKGYSFAEQSPDVFHSVGRFERESGKTPSAKTDFSAVFGQTVTELAEGNNDIVAVTAAMEGGTGLSCFAKKHRDRFFDVGIAEEHGMTFCAGMAAAGKRPVFAVYSSFLQRCYDQLIHDIAIQKLPVVIGVDRAGLVPGDGMTHQGIYDSAFFMGIPNFEVYTPENFADLKESLAECFKSDNPCAVRYPKGGENEGHTARFIRKGYISYTDIGEGEKYAAVITYGRITYNVCKAAEMLDGKRVRVIKLHRIKPVDTEELFDMCADFERIMIVEEGVSAGGLGEKISSYFGSRGRRASVHGIDGGGVFSGSVDELFEAFDLTPAKIAEKLLNI